MPTDPQPQPSSNVATVARFCWSCAGTIACWCLWIPLVALLAVQLYIAFAREFPVPGPMLHALDSKLTAENLAATFSRAQFDPTGRLVLNDARIRLLEFEDPLLVADAIYVRKSPWSVLSGARAPDEIRLAGATLQLPAPLSPTGLAQPLLRDAAATLRIDGGHVHVDQLTFRVGTLSVSVRGTYQLAPRPAGATPPLGETIARALALARQAALRVQELDGVKQPVLNATLSVRPGIGNVVELEFTADALRTPAGLDLATGPLHATASVRLDGEAERPVRVSFFTEQLEYRDLFTAQTLHGAVATSLTPRSVFRPEQVQLEASAARVAAFGETLISPDLTARWDRRGPLDFTLGVTLHGRTFAVAGQADLARSTAQIEVEGMAPPSLVDSVLDARAPRIAPYLRFLDPVQFSATAEFSPGWRFEVLRARVYGQRLNSNGVRVNAHRGRIELDRELNFLAHQAVISAGDADHARGIYWMNFRTWDFRVLLTGGLNPPNIAGWFRSRWWLDFWDNIRFPGPVPVADVDVQGNYRDATGTNYFGSTEARDAVVLGADLTSAHARVFVRPHFSHAFDLRVARAGGTQQAAGWFKRIADPVTRELRAFEFDLGGQLDPATLRHLGGPAADSLLAPWQFTTPPRIALVGRTDFRAGKSEPKLQFRGETTDRATYEGFPLGRVRAEGSVDGDEVKLDQIELAVAGGRGTAKAAVNGEGSARRIGFDFYLESADLVQAIRSINEFEAARAPAGEPPSSPNRELLKRATGGRLNFALSAQGRPADLASFSGSGNLEVKGAELGEVHLFGLLSQLLSGLSLNFSSLKLDTLRGSYRVADGRVNFPDIRVTGPTALIEGRGDYRLLDKTLDFTARFKPYEDNRNLLTGVVGIVMNPLASILELRLTGPIGKPAWSVSLGSSSAPREAPPPPPPSPTATPSPPAPAAEPPKRR